MNRLKLRLPTIEDKKIIMDYRREFIENNDNLDGTAGLSKYDDYKKWFQAVIDNSNEETVHDGLVQASTYLAISIEDEKLIGMIDIRHRLNEYLEKFGGHIGYSVRKSERRKGYATEILDLGLKECLKLDIKKVLLTCDKKNIGSAKTIINNNGVLENELAKVNTVTQRYWIDIS